MRNQNNQLRATRTIQGTRKKPSITCLMKLGAIKEVPSIESVPISPSVQDKIIAILKARGFSQYQ